MPKKVMDLAVFGKVDTDKEDSLAAAFAVRAIPTLVAFRDGCGVFARPGMLTANGLDDLIEKLCAIDMSQVRQKFEEEEKRIAGAP